MIQNIAVKVGKRPEEIREMNFSHDGWKCNVAGVIRTQALKECWEEVKLFTEIEKKKKEIERNGLATFSERQFSVCEEKYFLGVRCRSVFVSNLPTSLCLFVSFPRFSAVLRFVLPTAALPPSSFCFPAPTRPHPRPVVLCTHSHSIHQLAAPISSSNLCVQISLSQSANFRMAPASRSSRYFPFLYLSLLPPPFVSISDQFYHFCHPFVYLSPDRLIDFRRFHFLFVMNLFSSDFSSLQI